MKPEILLLSTSSVHGSGFLEYCRERLAEFLSDRTRLLFVPYACPGGMPAADYSEKVREALAPLGPEVHGAEQIENRLPGALTEFDAIFIGGGNTFLLLRDLYRLGMLEPITARVAEGMSYLGSSAGSNVAGLTIGTTNDMPIVYPPSFDALGLVPFNLNPHYLDPDPNSTHRGETRETRIREFLGQNRQPVLGLREGAYLYVSGGTAWMQGRRGGRLFRAGSEPQEVSEGADLSFLLG